MPTLLRALLVGLPGAALALAWLWGPAAQVAINRDFPAKLAVQVAPSGAAWVAWDEAGTLWTSQRPTPTAPWGTPQALGAGEVPVLAGGDGSPLLISNVEIAGDFEIEARRWTGSGWGEPINISNSPSDSFAPAATTGPDNTHYVAWSEAGQIQLGESSTGTTWEVAPIAIGGNIITGTAPAIAAPVTGTLLLAWQSRQAASGPFTISVARLRGGVWSHLLTLSAPETDLLSPALAATPTSFALAYRQGPTTWARVYDLDGTPIRALEVLAPEGPAPALVATPGGRFHLHAGPLVAHYEPGTTPSAPGEWSTSTPPAEGDAVALAPISESTLLAFWGVDEGESGWRLATATATRTMAPPTFKLFLPLIWR